MPRIFFKVIKARQWHRSDTEGVSSAADDNDDDNIEMKSGREI